MKNFLLVGGFDGTGGAGILADLKIANFLGLNPYFLTTVIAVQNNKNGFLNFPLPLSIIEDSLNAIFLESEIEWCKIGMVGSFEIADFLADYLSSKNVKIILDTPLKASNGFELQSVNSIKPLIEKSFLITPNKEEFASLEDVLKKFNGNVLVKSFQENESEIFDKLILYSNKNIKEEKIFNSKKLDLPLSVRGTGCSLASAICSFLFLGEALDVAISKARTVIFNGMKNADFRSQVGFLSFKECKNVN